MRISLNLVCYGGFVIFQEFVGDVMVSGDKSMSLTRRPGPPDEALRGSSHNIPYWPGSSFVIYDCLGS